MRQKYTVKPYKDGGASYPWQTWCNDEKYSARHHSTRKEAREFAKTQNRYYPNWWADKAAAEKAVKLAIKNEVKILKQFKLDIAEPFVVTQFNLPELKKLRETSPDRIVVAYKYSRADGRSPQYPTTKPEIVCAAGAVLSVPQAKTDPKDTCAAGVNVADPRWVFQSMGSHCPCSEFKAWLVKFRVKDIASIPNRTDGKFRLFRCLVADEISWYKLQDVVKTNAEQHKVSHPEKYINGYYVGPKSRYR